MWMWQAGTGIALGILLTTHMIANHFIAEGGLRDYAGVVAYLSNPWIFALETLFLIVAVAHALMGLRAIILDMGIPARADRRLRLGLSALGAGLVSYAIWLTARLIA